MKNRTKYTKEMYEYLAWRFFAEVYGIVAYDPEENIKFEKFVKGIRGKLSEKQQKILDNLVLRMKNEYEEWVMESRESRYGYNDDFRFEIEYNYDFYELWKLAVAKKCTVKLIYNSTTSGKTMRLVDPYRSNAPYGEGYCHSKKEVRKFRFDRVIDIEMTDKKFIKLGK